MLRSSQRLVGLAVLLAPIAISGLGCGGQGSVGLGGGSVTFTFGGETITFRFGFDPIEVIANQSTGRIPFGFNNPRGGDSATTPTSGTARLPSSNVTTGRRLSGKLGVRAQALPLNGTAIIRLYVASGISAEACDVAVLLAEYNLVFTTGTIAVLDETFSLSSAALAVLASKEVTVCVEIIADYDGLISIGDVDIDFGPDAPDSARFTLRNVDTVENIHILMPGEDFDDSNRLTPGSRRNTTLTNVVEGEVVSLRAGRNGTVLDTADCPAITGANYQAVADWDGFSLTCTASQDDAGSDSGDDPAPPIGTTIQVPVFNDGGFSDPAPVTTTIGGVDYGVVGVLYDETPLTAFFTTVPSSMSVDLSELGLSNVETIYMAVHSSFVADLPNGVDMGTLEINYTEGGSPTILDFVLGGNTAEWSYDRPENSPVPHGLATTLYTFPTTIDSGSEYLGREYDVILSADLSRTISCIELTIASGSTYSAFRDSSSSSATWASQYVAAMTFEGPAGSPSVIGSCDGTNLPSGDTCIFDSDCPAGQVCNDELACVLDDGGGSDEDCSADGVCNENCPVSTPDPDCEEVCIADGFCNENCSDLEPDPDCTTVSEGEPRCTARSDFETGDDGWTLVGDAEGGRSDPDYNFSGGSPGAYVSADDDALGGTWYFQAPLKYHGNFSASYGRTLTFDLRQSDVSSPFDNRDVFLTGAGMTIWFDTAMNPGADWTSYMITLDAAAGWLADDDSFASEADIRAVLADIEDLQIRGEYRVGADTGSLDNVVLNSDCQ